MTIKLPRKVPHHNQGLYLNFLALVALQSSVNLSRSGWKRADMGRKLDQLHDSSRTRDARACVFTSCCRAEQQQARKWAKYSQRLDAPQRAMFVDMYVYAVCVSVWVRARLHACTYVCVFKMSFLSDIEKMMKRKPGWRSKLLQQSKQADK